MNININDTIAAIATGLTDSGIGIIRISGPDAISIASKVFIPINKNKTLDKMKSYTAAFGSINYEGEVYDEAIALVMRAPHTYTTEDTVELDCHGGIVALRRVLNLIISLGARPADPGEFTKRAFMGGRIDLSQAESVMDLIHSKNEFAAKSSIKQLRGELKTKITEMREKILYNVAYIESALDDPENYSLDDFHNTLEGDVDNLLKSVENLVKSSDNGRLLKEGIRTVIVGKPNAGKSSVLNMLLGEERAIVTDIEGTTRDTLEEYINLDGIALNIVDTAGIRSTEDVIEKIGVDKAISSIDDADLVLYIVDSSVLPDENDSIIMSKIKYKKVLTILNKQDLDNNVDNLLIKSKINTELYGFTDLTDNENIIHISAKTFEGLDTLSKTIQKMFFSNEINVNDQLYITNQRHKSLLNDALSSLQQVKESILMDMSEDFLTIDLMSAYQSLGLIIGEEIEDDLANKIFAEFCMGK